MLIRIWTVVLLAALPVGFAASQETPATDELWAEWERVVTLRESGDPAGAADILRDIIATHPDDPEILKRAYHEIVFTRLLHGGTDSAREAAREALILYPDLSADPIYFPAAVNALYDEERRLMYGALSIRKPEGALIIIDGEEVGTIPWFEPYWPVGSYNLTLVREDYHDLEQEIVVEPDGSQHLEVSMVRRKDFGYWAPRIGGGILVAGLVTGVVISSTDSGSDQLTMLGGPPDPP